MQFVISCASDRISTILNLFMQIKYNSTTARDSRHIRLINSCGLNKTLYLALMPNLKSVFAPKNDFVLG